MAIRLHGSARTTPRIRAVLQLATGSHRSLAKLYGINPKTVAKWRARTSVLDEPIGPRGRTSQHLSQEQEHLVIALRKQMHLSLDDLMGQLLETASKLSRSALHRCLQRHGISRRPTTHVPRSHGKFEETTLGFVHIDSAEMKISSCRQHMFVAIDRVTKFTHVAFFDRATKANAAQFLPPCALRTLDIGKVSQRCLALEARADRLRRSHELKKTWSRSPRESRIVSHDSRTPRFI